ncbi:MAG: Mth938-like domain-containing protein [Rubrobacter sp.]
MADESTTSPRVTVILWGRLETEDAIFKDAKLFPGGAREWDWNESATSHEPGVDPADVEELLDRGATALVIGTGFYGRLRVRRETLDTLEERGVATHVLRTEEAVDVYNELRDVVTVAALIHSTC